MRDPARSRREALDRYRHYLQLTVSCVSRLVWQTRPTLRGGGELDLFLAGGPAQMQAASGEPIWLSSEQNFHFRFDSGLNEWRITTDAYAYTLTQDPAVTHELISWHWHPTTRHDTHLHIGRDHPDLPPILGMRAGKMHVPTGRVFFEEVISFLIKDLGVEPLRDDWEEVLGDSLERVRHYRSW